MANRGKTRDVPADITRNANISTENQPKGAARNPSDTLDREPRRDPLSGGSIPGDYDPRTMTREGEEKRHASRSRGGWAALTFTKEQMMQDQRKDRRDRDEMPRGPLGDARPDAAKGKGTTKGGQPPEDVEDRPSVSAVKPEDYPSQQ